ncbi:MAG: hypothetical protein OES38_16365 [Gammaproteobacteria bacterium]|nr:hypothetical protein [Gammaproteobacteria bacterium]
MSLKATVLLLCLVTGATGVLLVTFAIARPSLPVLGFGALLLALTAGLYLMQPWARYLGLFFSWATLCFVVVGYTANPFVNADRMAFGQAPLEWHETLLRSAPILIPCLWLIHVLVKHRSAFVTADRVDPGL